MIDDLHPSELPSDRAFYSDIYKKSSVIAGKQIADHISVGSERLMTMVNIKLTQFITKF